MEQLIKEFLIDKALILLPCLMILGAILKNTPKLPNWLIPYIMLVLGILGGIGLIGFNAQGIIQGILVAGSAVFTHQLVKQTGEGISINSFNTKDGGQ